MRAALTGLALLLLAGCSVTPSPHLDAAAPERSWLPTGEPRADILTLHGFGDHKAAFADFGRYMAAHGVAVHAFDFRGFGESPDFGIWPGDETLLAQFQDELARIERASPKRPLFVLGHSMGAALVTIAAARGFAREPDGIALVAPAVWGGETLNGFYRGVLGIASRVVPWLRLSSRGIPVRASDNIEELRARGRDPLFLKEPLVGMVAGLVDIMDEARKAAPALEGRVLVLIGEKDEIVPPAAQTSFTAAIGTPSCSLLRYPDGWHLLLQDLQREKVFADLLRWIDAPNAAPPGATPCRTAHS